MTPDAIAVLVMGAVALVEAVLAVEAFVRPKTWRKR